MAQQQSPDAQNDPSETVLPPQIDGADPASDNAENDASAAHEIVSENAVAASAEPAPEAVEQPILQACPNCATLIDITDEEPLSQVHCPICGTAIRARTQIKNFTLVETLGSGGMGAVYKARDVNLNRMVALKVIRKEYSADPEYLAKFEREARITASVTHPNVVKVFSFGSDHGLYYIAMELVDKGSLDDLMSLQGRVAEIQVLDVGIQAAQGLEAAHQRGLIHRDVKPGNILFSDARTAKLVDFGLALLAEHEAEERGEIWGTPYYVAPEKLEHLPEDFRSDIYSLGATLFHATSGRPPFEAETASLVALKHLKSQAVSIQAFAPDVSAATAYVINRMLHKDPEQRYQSYDELLEHLQYAKTQLQESLGKPRQPKQRVVVESEKQQNIVGLITLLLLVLLIGLGIAAFVFRDRLFNKAETPGAAITSRVQPQSQLLESVVSDKYQSIRKQMLDGDFTAAQDAFKQLATEQNPQPLENWIIFHQGLSALLAGHDADARETFRALHDRGMFSQADADKALASFFVETGQLAMDEKTVSRNVTKTPDTTNFGALKLLACALKDWELGKPEEASEILQAFLAANPSEQFSWINDYKPLAQKYAADFIAYKKIADAISAAATPQQLDEAHAQIKQFTPQMHGKLNERLLAQERRVRNKAEAQQQEIAARAAAEHAAADKAFAPAREQFAAFCANLDFAKALAAVQQSANVADPGIAQEKAALMKKAQWLQGFKATLENDINKIGYPGPLPRKNAAPLTGSVKRANDAQVEIVTPYGSIPTPWTNIPPAAVLAMANYFIKTAPTPAAAADREWLTGVFAVQMNLPDARALLTHAAQTKEQYRNDLTLFPDAAK